MNRPEETLHKAVVQLLKLDGAAGVIWYHPANGEARSARTGARLKLMGVRPGVADLALVLPGGVAAFLELKAPKGRMSPAQKDFRDACAANSTRYATVNSIDDARAVLAGWGALAGKVSGFREIKFQ